MRVALGIVSLFASGGLQRDCLQVRDALQRRGHHVDLFAGVCQPQVARSQLVTLLEAPGWTNHGRDARFSHAFQLATRAGYDAIVGFNKLQDLDVLYCADPSVLAKPVPAWQRRLPRYRTRLALEEACFGPAAHTHALMLTPAAAQSYREAWQLCPDRLSVLPPTLAANREQPQLRTGAQRTSLRAEYGCRDSDMLWLWIAAQPRTKGLDRVLEALRADSGARLLVVGLAPGDRSARGFVSLASRLQIEGRLCWLGPREDIPALMAAADVLVHPARFDTTGQVILEAVVNGLPVITTAACGFAEHVARGGAGIVLPEPFEAPRLAEALAAARNSETRRHWTANALRYASQHQFTRGFEIAAETIERIAKERQATGRATGH